MTDSVKYMLEEADMPKVWYNIAADLPTPLPPVLHPGTKQPIGPDDLAVIFPMGVIQPEVTIPTRSSAVPVVAATLRASPFRSSESVSGAAGTSSSSLSSRPPARH